MKFDEAMAAITKTMGATPEQSAAIREHALRFASLNNLTPDEAVALYLGAAEPFIHPEGTYQS